MTYDHPALLYKYCSLERIDVLKDDRIRFTQPGEFNDLFETRPVIHSLAEPPYIEEALNEYVAGEGLQQTYQELAPTLRSILPFPLFQQLVTAMKPQIAQGMEEMTAFFLPGFMEGFLAERDKQLGILSLSEHPNSILMWGHYCEGNSGFVIGFDASNAFFHQRRSEKDELRHLRKVLYYDGRPTLPAIQLDGTTLFLAKSRDWEYEAEWRMLMPLQGASAIKEAKPFPIHLFDFPPEAVGQVVLGPRMPRQSREEALRILEEDRYRHVKVLEARMHATEYGIELVPHVTG